MPPERQPSIRVLLVDDHQAVRHGLAELLGKTEDIEVIGEAPNGAAAIRLAQRRHPDIILMDVVMPGNGGIAATRALHQRHPEIKIIALSLYAVMEYISSMLEAGVQGYLLKESVYTEVAAAIRVVHAGGLYIDRSLYAAIARELLHLALHAHRNELQLFTAAETRVLEALAEGKQPAEAAQSLEISVREVEKHIIAVIRKWLK
ncbi:MAG TPA: response regulator transcription factor [bacterium]|nr:response regulator transcription factor [bacterium]HPR87699.1 response regulator transcription factor [bacterium]